MMILATAAATVLGVTLSVGIASAPAAGADGHAATASVLPSAPAADPLAREADAAVLPVVEAEAAVDAAAAVTAEVAASGLEVTAAPPVDVAELQEQVDALRNRDALPSMVRTVIAGTVETETAEVEAATVALQEALTVAQQKKAAEDAARAAAEKEKAAAAALAAANSVDGARATARQLMADRYGWGGDQFSCLDSLWTKESGWNYQAYNASSGATGIPQALPGDKMATAGADWQSNAATQIAWGLGYISAAYGTPCSAWGHSQATDWY